MGRCWVLFLPLWQEASQSCWLHCGCSGGAEQEPLAQHNAVGSGFGVRHHSVPVLRGLLLLTWIEPPMAVPLPFAHTTEQMSQCCFLPCLVCGRRVNPCGLFQPRLSSWHWAAPLSVSPAECLEPKLSQEERKSYCLPS